MPIVIPTSTPTNVESLALDGLEVFGSPWYVESINFGIPASLAEWIKGADSQGAILAREPLHENRVIEVRLSLEQQDTMDAALVHIAALEDKLQEAARNANGLPLVWTPGETTPPITFRCLLGEITEIPMDWQTGYYVRAPTVGVRLTCLPFGEGTETQIATVTSAAPIIPLELAGVDGDVPALGRLVVTDAASQARRYVAWGLESRHYDDATSLIIDSMSMVTTGFAGTMAFNESGAYNGAIGNVVGVTLRPQTQAICGLGNLSHVGAFRPQIRFRSPSTSFAVRLTYQALDGPSRSLSFKGPVTAGWNHVDMGLITIPEATLGTQRWTGQIEAFSTAIGGEALYIDAIWLMPAEQYGRARAPYSYRPGVLTGFDDFIGIASGAALNGRAAPIGGTWATSGSATDFTGGAYLADTVQRATVSDASARLAILGSTNYTDAEVIVDFLSTALTGSSGVVARYVDANNYLWAQLNWDNFFLVLYQVVAGTVTELAAVNVPQVRTDTTFQVRFTAFASGRLNADLLDRNGALIQRLGGSSTAAATGGALATGKAGFRDYNPSATTSTRVYGDVYASTPAAEPIVCHAGQSIEFRHDETMREDSTGVYAGDPPEYVGGRFTIPNAGGPARKARVAVIARRNDVVTTADDTITSNAVMDSTTVTVWATPRYLAVPRA